MTNKQSSKTIAATAAGRRRLSPELRIQQILDAAFVVFAEKGFVSARMDDIAAAAGLSKGGIYNHFRSKEQIFEELLKHRLNQYGAGVEFPDDDRPVTVERIITDVVEPLYASFSNPDVIRILRLVLVDGNRVPEFVRYWHSLISQPYQQRLQILVQKGVVAGTLRNGSLTDSPALIVSPALVFMFDTMVDSDNARQQLENRYQAHARMLREMLTPPV